MRRGHQQGGGGELHRPGERRHNHADEQDLGQIGAGGEPGERAREDGSYEPPTQEERGGSGQV